MSRLRLRLSWMLVATAFLAAPVHSAQAPATAFRVDVLFIGPVVAGSGRDCKVSAEVYGERLKSTLRRRENLRWINFLPDAKLREASGGKDYGFDEFEAGDFRLARELGRRAGAGLVFMIERHAERMVCQVTAYLLDVGDSKGTLKGVGFYKGGISQEESAEETRKLFQDVLGPPAREMAARALRPQAAPAEAQAAKAGPGESEDLKKQAEEARRERAALEARLKEAESLKKEREAARAEMEQMRREREALAGKQKALEEKLRAEERRIVEERNRLSAAAKAEEERKRKAQEEQTRAYQFELAFWDTIRNSQNPADYQAYLQKYPDGQFAALARIRSQQTTQSAMRAPAAGGQAVAKKADDTRPNLYGRTGNYHALVIGINDYQHVKPLKSAVPDAKAVAESLERGYGFKVNLLINAKRYDILAALSRLRSTLTERDNLLIYYAGHGILDKDANTGYWLPADAEKDITANWVATHDVTTALRAMNARHVMVIADSCYSGTLTRSAPSGIRSGREKVEWLRRVAAKRSRTVITSGGLEPVQDSGGGGHSVFAKEFLNALRENAWVLDGNELFERLKRPVVVNSQQTPEYSDIRNTGHDGGEFLFVRKP